MNRVKLGEYDVRRESWDSQCEARRHNPARVLLFLEYKRGKRFACRHRWVIPAGDGDDVFYYREGREVACLSVRRSLGYVGLCVWSLDSDDDNPIGEIFLQNAEEELPGMLQSLRGTRRVKSDVFEYSPEYLARVLWDWIAEVSS